MNEAQKGKGNGAVEKAKVLVEAAKPLARIEDLIRESARQLGDALPTHMRPERIVRIALTTLRMNPKITQCDPLSILGALFQSAQLGLEPNTLGEAWIIPYNVSVKDANGQWRKRMVAQFQVGYLGYVKLFWNHQSAVSLQMETVHEKDEFRVDLGENTIHHVPPPIGEDRGKAIGYYAVGRLAGGGMVVKVMSVAEAQRFGQRFSRCFDRKEGKFYSDTPWAEHFDAMAKKSVLKQLMKLLPKSVEIQHAIAMDETVKSRILPDMVQVPDEDDHAAEEVQEAVVAGAESQTAEQVQVPGGDELFGEERK